MELTWLIVIAAYFLGSIPTAYLVGRAMGRGDIRELGDGNPGAKNAFHVLGPKAGIIIFFFDAAKAAVAILIAEQAHLSPSVIMFTGIAVMLGHIFPLVLNFRGGEGTACAIGILAVLITVPMLILAPLTMLVLIIKRNVDLALAFLFIPVAPLCLWLGYSPSLALYSIILPCLVAVIHFTRRYMRRARIA